MVADSCTRALFLPMDLVPLAKTNLVWAEWGSRFTLREVQIRRLVDSSWMRDGLSEWFSHAAPTETSERIQEARKQAGCREVQGGLRLYTLQ